MGETPLETMMRMQMALPQTRQDALDDIRSPLGKQMDRIEWKLDKIMRLLEKRP